MRVSYSLGSLLSVDNVLECARNLESHDIDTVWIPETWGMECFSMMGAISQILTKPRIGSSIINIYSRSPSLVAMGAVTSDTLNGGRTILGLGTSSPAIVKSLHGTEYEAPLERMREYVDIIRLACSGKKIEYNGKFFSLSGFRILIRPVREKIPIYMAAVGPRMLETALEIADGTILYLRPLKELKNTINKMSLQKPDFDVACQIITAISEDIDAAQRRAKSTISFYIAVSNVYSDFLALNGYAKEAETIRAEYKKTGVPQQPELVPDSMVSELAICGEPESCREQLQKFKDAGVNHPILQFNPVGDVSESFNLVCRTFSET